MKYKVTFDANNTSYKAEGETLFEALGNIPLNSLDLKTKGDIIVTHGKRKSKLHFVLMQGRNLLRNHIRRQGFAYQLEALLK